MLFIWLSGNVFPNALFNQETIVFFFRVRSVRLQAGARHAYHTFLDDMKIQISRYTMLHMFTQVLFWAGNQGDHQNVDSFMLTKKL